MALSRRNLLVAGGLSLVAAGGTYALTQEQSGPILKQLPVAGKPDGYVVAAYQPNPLSWRVLDPRTGRYVARDGSYAAPSPDLRYILAWEYEEFSRSTRVLDTGTGAVVHDFGRTWNLPLGWSPDGRHIVLGNVVFHDVGSKEDNYFTVDRVRVFDVLTGQSRKVAGWVPTRTMPEGAPWWTTDGRLVYPDRLIAMDGSMAGRFHDGTPAYPVLGTDLVRSAVDAGRSYVMGEHTVDLRTASTSDAVPHELDTAWLGTREFGFWWLAWLDDNRVIGQRDHDVSVYDVRDRTRRAVMTFPDDVVTNALIAPATDVPATIR